MKINQLFGNYAFSLLLLLTFIALPVFAQIAPPQPPPSIAGTSVNTSLMRGKRAVITDAGQLYSTINTGNCIDWSWATPEQKKLGGTEGWNGFYPKNGDTGEIVFETKHCNSGIKVYILKIGNYYAPIGESGVKLTSGDIPLVSGMNRRAVITDTGKLYTTINTTSCLNWDWATPQQKSLSGSSGWGTFYPQVGNEGEIVNETMHCDGSTKIFIVKVGNYYVPIGANGVRLGGAATRPATGGKRAVITDAGQLYSTINTGTCLNWDWATPQIKTLAGEKGWNGFYPKNGDEGEVVYETKHCDSGVKIYILKIGNYYAPVGESGVRLVSGSAPVSSQTADDYLKLGDACYEKKDYPCAITNYTKTIELAPKYAAAYTDRANAYDDSGNSALALADYSTAIQLDPKNANSYYNRGITYSRINNLDKAISDYTKAIQLDPKYANPYINRGNGYYKQGKYNQAIDDYTNYIALEPKAASGYRNRALALRQLNRIAEAEADERKVEELK